MALVVQTTSGGDLLFPSANSWHIDDEDSLHISGPSDSSAGPFGDTGKRRPIASFAAGGWIGVWSADDYK